MNDAVSSCVWAFHSGRRFTGVMGGGNRFNEFIEMIIIDDIHRYRDNKIMFTLELAPLALEELW